MAETMMTAARPRRGGLILATVGVAMIALAMLVVALVIWDKKHFGGMVGPSFLGIVGSGVILGALAVLVGAWMLPRPTTWRTIVLYVWGLIALTSPLLGYLFLLPWAVLVVMLPVVIVALVGLSKTY